MYRTQDATLRCVILGIAACVEFAPFAAASTITNQTWSLDNAADTAPDPGFTNPGNPKLTPSPAATFIKSIVGGPGNGNPGWLLSSDAASLDFAIPNLNMQNLRKSISVTVRYWPPAGISPDDTFPDVSVSNSQLITPGIKQPAAVDGSTGLRWGYAADVCGNQEAVNVTRHITDSSPQSIYIDSVNVFTTCWSPTPPPPPPPAKKASSVGHSVSFDAANGGILTFKNDVITDTGIPNDPLDGASVNLPQFRTAGPIDGNGDIFLFANQTSDPFTITKNGQVYVTADAPDLFYQSSTNSFYFMLENFKLAGASLGSPFFDPSLPALTGTYLQQVDSILNPNSASFDPSQSLYFTYTPDANIQSLTSSFNSTALDLSGTNAFFTSTPAPEPAAFPEMAACALGLIGYLYRHRVKRLVPYSFGPIPSVFIFR